MYKCNLEGHASRDLNVKGLENFFSHLLIQDVLETLASFSCDERNIRTFLAGKYQPGKHPREIRNDLSTIFQKSRS